MAWDPCAKCEELMQPYMDRVLTHEERIEAEAHLDLCEYCKRRYRFEARLRVFVREAAVEPMPADLRDRLSGLRPSV
jgi:hypothetical protein